jgi:glyoxylase I family protein
MLHVETLHHVALPVSDLIRARLFYGTVLGLQEIARPAFDFDGAWYEVGDRQLHLIVSTDQTFRLGKSVNSRDIHFAIRVKSFRRALEQLQSNGYRPDHENPLLSLRVNRRATAGFPQIYLLDPDRNMIEINAERED